MTDWLKKKFFSMNCSNSTLDTLQCSNSENAPAGNFETIDFAQIANRLKERSCELPESTTDNSGEGVETEARNSTASNDRDLVSQSRVTALDEVDTQVEEGVEVTSNDDEDKALTKFVKNFAGNEKDGKRSNSDFQTLGEALKYFGLYSRLKSLESSLEEVRRRRKTRKDHESDLKRLDKEILQLCYKHHPDRVANRGGSEAELEEAKKRQASLNAIRTVLSVLNKIFLDNIDVDQMYGFYTKLSISFLGNEKELREHVSEVFFKINYLSEIKHQNIIPEIRKFLEAGKDCLRSYEEGDVHDFIRCRDVALTHLRACIMGYIKLQAQLETVEEQVKGKSLDNIRELVKKMSSECARDLSVLREVKHAAKESLNGTCKIFEITEPIDEYFVLPLVRYVNAIILCNSMVVNENRNVLKTYWNKFRNFLDSDILGIAQKDGDRFDYLYILASYFSGNEQYKDILNQTLEGKHTDKEEIKKVFLTNLNPLIAYLDDTFRVENYIEGKRTQFVEDCMKFLKTMAKVDEKEKKVRNGIEILENRQRDIEERLEKALKKSMEVSNETKKCFEQDKLHACKATTALFLSETEIKRFEQALKKRAEVRNIGCLQQDELPPDEGTASLLSAIDRFEQAVKKRAEVTNETKRCLKQDKLRNGKGSAPLFKGIEIGVHGKTSEMKPEANNENKKCSEQDILQSEEESPSKENENDRLESALKNSEEVSKEVERYMKQNIPYQEKESAALLEETEIDRFKKALKKGAEVIFETKRCLEQDSVCPKKRSASPLKETGIDF